MDAICVSLFSVFLLLLSKNGTGICSPDSSTDALLSQAGIRVFLMNLTLTAVAHSPRHSRSLLRASTDPQTIHSYLDIHAIHSPEDNKLSEITKSCANTRTRVNDEKLPRAFRITNPSIR